MDTIHNHRGSPTVGLPRGTVLDARRLKPGKSFPIEGENAQGGASCQVQEKDTSEH